MIWFLLLVGLLSLIWKYLLAAVVVIVWFGLWCFASVTVNVEPTPRPVKPPKPEPPRYPRIPDLREVYGSVRPPR